MPTKLDFPLLFLLPDKPDTQFWTVEGDSYSESYTYDTGDGSLQSMTAAGGQTLSYTYDALKRHTGITVKKNNTTIFTVAKSYYNHPTICLCTAGTTLFEELMCLGLIFLRTHGAG